MAQEDNPFVGDEGIKQQDDRMRERPVRMQVGMQGALNGSSGA